MSRGAPDPERTAALCLCQLRRLLLAEEAGLTLYRHLDSALSPVRNLCNVQSGTVSLIAMVISLTLNLLLIPSVVSMFIAGRASNRT